MLPPPGNPVDPLPWEGGTLSGLKNAGFCRPGLFAAAIVPGQESETQLASNLAEFLCAFPRLWGGAAGGGGGMHRRGYSRMRSPRRQFHLARTNRIEAPEAFPTCR